MRTYLLRNVDKFMDYIDSVSTFWGIVVILLAVLLFAPVCISIFWGR